MSDQEHCLLCPCSVVWSEFWPIVLGLVNANMLDADEGAEEELDRKEKVEAGSTSGLKQLSVSEEVGCGPAKENMEEVAEEVLGVIL